LQFAAHASVEENIPALFVSLEQGRTELAERLLCAYARIDSYKVRRGHINSEEQTRIIDAGDKIGRAKLFLDDTPQQNMMRIAANARRLKSRNGIEVIFVDYLQLIDADNPRSSRQEQVSAISRRLKGLARELKIPVVAMAQLNRASEDRANSRPKLSDLRESGAIEQDADTVIMLHRTEEERQRGVVEAIVAKQRNGPTGDCKLLYVKEHMRFENMAVANS
jgi:replicative DNA helicase